jgi:hypothetical protein
MTVLCLADADIDPGQILRRAENITLPGGRPTMEARKLFGPIVSNEITFPLSRSYHRESARRHPYMANPVGTHITELERNGAILQNGVNEDRRVTIPCRIRSSRSKAHVLDCSL